MSLRTANHNRRRAQRRRVYLEAFAYHTRRSARLSASGRLDKLARSSFIARQDKRQRLWTEAQGK